MTAGEYFGDWMEVIDGPELRRVVTWMSKLDKSILCPSSQNVFKAFQACSLKDCKVVFLGQDPYPQLQIEIEDTSIYLNHYPFLCYGGSYRGVWQLFGHVHSGPGADGLDTSRLRVLLPTQYDVGVDNNNFTPISYREVKNKIEAQKNESLDRAKA